MPAHCRGTCIDSRDSSDHTSKGIESTSLSSSRGAERENSIYKHMFTALSAIETNEIMAPVQKMGATEKHHIIGR